MLKRHAGFEQHVASHVKKGLMRYVDTSVQSDLIATLSNL